MSQGGPVFKSINPKRGEIWRVNLEPTVGREIQKSNRPVLILSRPNVGERDLRLCVPLTDFKPERDNIRFWRVVVGDSGESGLSKLSCADVSQTRALDISRFLIHAGKAQTSEVEATARALANAIGLISTSAKQD